MKVAITATIASLACVSSAFITSTTSSNPNPGSTHADGIYNADVTVLPEESTTLSGDPITATLTSYPGGVISTTATSSDPNFGSTNPGGLLSAPTSVSLSSGTPSRLVTIPSVTFSRSLNSTVRPTSPSVVVISVTANISTTATSSSATTSTSSGSSSSTSSTSASATPTLFHGGASAMNVQRGSMLGLVGCAVGMFLL